jgi:hypothetical protein
VTTFLDGAIGPSFFTPTQVDFTRTRQRYGNPDDASSGAYFLDQIHWNKEGGTASYSTLDPRSDGWYGGPGTAKEMDEQAGQTSDCGCGGGCGGC